MVYSAETLPGQFYTTKQYDDEAIGTWTFRLGEILRNAKDWKNINSTESNNHMPTSIFFDGLRPELKNIARYTKCTITEFDALFRAVRHNESQHNLKPLPKQKPIEVTESMTTTENEQIQ